MNFGNQVFSIVCDKQNAISKKCCGDDVNVLGAATVTGATPTLNRLDKMGCFVNINIQAGGDMTAITLPVGFRPLFPQYVSAVVGSAAIPVLVAVDGTMTLRAGTVVGLFGDISVC